MSNMGNIFKANEKMDTSSSTTQKHKIFVAEPMNNKAVTAIAGIGSVAERKLKEHGITSASILFGYFLIFEKDQTKFIELLETKGNISAHNARRAYETLNEWCLFNF
jgi:hypothetical protein